MPPSPFPIPVAHSIEALPPSSPLREIYPEDIYAGGEYFSSPYGRTKFWINGPTDGRKIVLIHGISVPALAFRKFVPALVEKGLQVLTYDLPGRGYSEAPEALYDATFYTVHLALLLQYVKWDKADIIGYSMGGAVAAAFAATFPHLVTENVALLASAGLLPVTELATPKSVQSSDTDEWGADITSVVLAPARNTEASAEAGKLSIQLRDLQWQYLPGAKKAFRTSLVSGVISFLRTAFETLAKSPERRFLVIHGTADTTVPYREALKIQKLIPQAKLVLIDGASHALPWEEETWQEVLEEIIQFVTGRTST